MSNPPSQNELPFEFNIPAGREAFRVWEVAALLVHSDDWVIERIEEGKFGTCIDCGGGSKTSFVIPRAGLVKFIRENSK